MSWLADSRGRVCCDTIKRQRDDVEPTRLSNEGFIPAIIKIQVINAPSSYVCVPTMCSISHSGIMLMFAVQ